MQPPSVSVMLRRDLLAASVAVGLVTRAAAEPAATPFDGSTVKRLARESAAAAFKPADRSLPDSLAKLDYDAYRTLRFDPAQSLWRGAGLPFEAQFFHRGWLYPDRVDIFEVIDGTARPVVYRPDMFTFGPGIAKPNSDLGFAGFRLHAPINRPDYYDEVCVFLGASYFRAVAKREGYGLSSRGLSLKPATRAARSSRPSAASGSNARRTAPTASLSMPCSTARAAPAPCASPSGPVTPRSWTWRPRYTRASTSTKWASATPPACSTSPPATAPASTTTAAPYTIPTD